MQAGYRRVWGKPDNQSQPGPGLDAGGTLLVPEHSPRSHAALTGHLLSTGEPGLLGDYSCPVLSACSVALSWEWDTRWRRPWRRPPRDEFPQVPAGGPGPGPEHDFKLLRSLQCAPRESILCGGRRASSLSLFCWGLRCSLDNLHR